MLIYRATKGQFVRDVDSGHIAYKIENQFYKHGISHNNDAEYVSWENSLKAMRNVIGVPSFSDDVQVAVEYQIPQTSKRVDFLIGGRNENDEEKIVVVELKQWEEAHHTTTDGIVTAFTGGMNRAVAHPSYQAYSYAKTIENFNATIQDEGISLSPCAYLHNYKKNKLNEITDPIYSEIIELAPLYIKNEEDKLRSFISAYIAKPPVGDLLYKVDNGRIRPSKALQDTLTSMLAGNEEFIMIDEQKVVYEAVKNLVKRSQEDGNKYTIIIEGGPGTGKSVVAIQLLADLTASENLVVSYVTKNAAPREVYFAKLKQGKAKNNYIKALFKSSSQFWDCKENLFDCLIVDEAHRLNRKSSIFHGENQIKEIINSSKVSVFFIDEDQIVTGMDIGSVAEIRKWANELGSHLYCGERYNLTSQFRCNGSDGYIAFLNDLLGIRNTANYNGFSMEYDLKVYDDPCLMREDLRVKNNVNNKSRMLAGYCYEWITKNSNDPSIFDIEIADGFRAKWNFGTTKTWAIDKDSFDQVGCIHTSQGLEFDYVGVIIGKDLRYEDGKVITDKTMRAATDKSLSGTGVMANKEEVIDRIIRNTYKTLMTRGQKGCYVYCEDPALQEYMKYRIEIANENKE